MFVEVAAPAAGTAESLRRERYDLSALNPRTYANLLGFETKSLEFLGWERPAGACFF
jgi:hypothetical protein